MREDQTLHGVLPASIAGIELGAADDVRPGQPMTASVVLSTEEFFTCEVQKPENYVFKSQQAWLNTKKLGYDIGFVATMWTLARPPARHMILYDVLGRFHEAGHICSLHRYA